MFIAGVGGTLDCFFEAFADEGSSGASQPRSEASGTVPSRAVSPIRLPPFTQQMMVYLPLECYPIQFELFKGLWFVRGTCIILIFPFPYRRDKL